MADNKDLNRIKVMQAEKNTPINGRKIILSMISGIEKY